MARVAMLLPQLRVCKRQPRNGTIEGVIVAEAQRRPAHAIYPNTRLKIVSTCLVW